MTKIEEQVVVSERERRTLISWGAVLAGLALAVAISWLMMLFGAAIGVTVADANDSFGVSQEFGIGAVVWMLVTGLVAFFLGALLAARLSGKAEDTSGIMHGVTLWSAATLLMILMGYWGVAAMLRTAHSTITATAGVAADAASGVAGTMADAAPAAAKASVAIADSQFADNLGDRIKRQAAQAVAKRDAQGGPDVNRQEVVQALEELDSKTLQNIASKLVQGDEAGAKDELAAATNLSDREVNDLIQGVKESVKESAAVAEVQQQLQQASRKTAQSISSQLSQLGGSNVSQQEVRRAIEQLDGPTLKSVATHVINGNLDAAKDKLAANTTLSDQEVHSIVEGIQSEADEQIAAFKKQVNQTTEAASDYVTTVLWSAFAAGALGLLASILGGWLGSADIETLKTVAARRRVKS